MPNTQGGALLPNNNPKDLPALPPLAAGASAFGAPAALNSFTANAPTKPVGTISTQDGQNALSKTIAQATKLSPAPVAPVTPADTSKTGASDAVKGTAVETAPTKVAADAGAATKVTLINPATEQSVTFNDASISKDNIQAYLKSGYQLSEAAGTLPDWLGPNGVAAPNNTSTILADSTKTLNQAQTDLTSMKTQLQSLSQNIGNDPQLRSILQNIGAGWDQRMNDMQNTEDSRIAALTTTGMRLGSQYTGGAGGMTGGIVSAEERAAIGQIASLQSQKEKALMDAQQAFESQKWTQYNDLVQNAQKSYDSILTHVQHLQDAQAAQDQKIKDQQNAAMTDSNIAAQYAKGVTSPADILAALKKGGDSTTTLDTIGKAITALTPPGIPDLVKTLTTNGAPGSVIQAVLKAGDLNAAYAAAGNYAAGGSGMVGEYNFYKAQATAAGQTPVDFNTYQNMDANRKANAAAAASGLDFGSPISTDGTKPIDNSSSGSILAQTGLSLPAFNYLTVGTAALTRLGAKDRSKIMNEAQSWLINKGIDNSTFASQYKAYNDVLGANISRFNKTKVMEGEVTGGADTFVSTVGKDFGNLKPVIVGQLMAGQQINDPTAQKYSFQIKNLQNDLAGYFAAARGDTSPNLSDQQDAADVIKSGLSAGGAAAFKESVQASTEKMLGVMQTNIDSTRQNVWDLFGVGDKYKPSLTGTQIAAQEKTATGAIANYVKKNPSQADAMATAADSVNPKTGQKYTASEIAQIYSIDSSSASGANTPPLPTATIPTTGTFKGFDWGSLFSGLPKFGQQ